MREILFRGKRVDDGKWVYGFYCHYDDTKDNGKDDCDYIVEKHNGEYFPFVKVTPETVGQYTGLTDKNGKEIFEGDVLKYTRKNWHNIYEKEFEGSFKGRELVTYLEIYYDDTCAAFKYRHYNENKKLFSDGILRLKDSRAEETIIEIIGNIHDNPELLEENKNVQ